MDPLDLENLDLDLDLERITKEISKKYDKSLKETVGVYGKDWEIGDKIGRGAFASVYIVKPLKDNSKPEYVAKDVSFDPVEDSKNGNLDFYLKSFTNELEVLDKIRGHERIVPFIGALIYDTKLSIIMKYMEMGTLRQYSEDLRGLSERETKHFTRQLLEGVLFLHENGIIHCDLKGQNVLMKNKYEVLITDFGVSKILQDASCTESDGVGTKPWKAPEVEKLDGSNATYNEKADIWSLGCTVLEIWIGLTPCTCCLENLDHNFLGSNFPPSELRCFFEKTLQQIPSNRPSAKDLLDNDNFVNPECFIRELKRKSEDQASKIKSHEIETKRLKAQLYLGRMWTLDIPDQGEPSISMTSVDPGSPKPTLSLDILDQCEP